MSYRLACCWKPSAQPMEMQIDWKAIADLLRYDPAQPMLFNSGTFLLLFLLFYGLFLLWRERILWRTLYFFGFSLFFYYKSSGFFFVLLIASTLVDFVLGHFIFRAKTRGRQRFFLFLSLVANLGILGYFKYANFFLDTSNTLFGSRFDAVDIFLPVGISFFTFQTMSYSIDVYRRKIRPLTEEVTDVGSFFRQLLDFGFFVSFFPQLVAGPIVRAAEFIPQIRQPLRLSRDDLGRALLLIMGGLFKKAVISDYISVNYVDRVFESPELYSGFENLMAVYGYAVQIYCDFSGYSDMAIGLALLLGFRLPENFRLPYRAYNVQDFWRRWHISLSTWLRDYLYISLGGNRKGTFRTYINLMVTMLLGGLWHGASWVFILWGGLHGLALAFDRALRPLLVNPALRAMFLLLLVQGVGQLLIEYLFANGLLLDRAFYRQVSLGNGLLALAVMSLSLLALLSDWLGSRWQSGSQQVSRMLATVFTFHFVCFCWVFFRAGALGNPNPPLATAGGVLGQIFGAFRPEMARQVLAAFPIVFGLIALGMVLHFLPRRWDFALERAFLRSPLPVKALSLAGVAWLAIQAASADVVPFIYFQF